MRAAAVFVAIGHDVVRAALVAAQKAGQQKLALVASAAATVRTLLPGSRSHAALRALEKLVSDDTQALAMST